MQKPIIFQSIFGDSWDKIPPVMHKHYANRANSTDRVTVEGFMSVELSFMAKLFAPIMMLVGVLVPHEGRNIPTMVHFDSSPKDNSFRFNRIFHFPNKQPYHFRSRMVPTGGKQVIEFMKGGIGWHAAYSYDGRKVLITHVGYKLKLLGKIIPLPLEIFIGKGYAEEEALDDNHFRMYMDINHPLFGKIYAYSGQFKISEVKLSE